MYLTDHFPITHFLATHLIVNLFSGIQRRRRNERKPRKGASWWWNGLSVAAQSSLKKPYNSSAAAAASEAIISSALQLSLEFVGSDGVLKRRITALFQGRLG